MISCILGYDGENKNHRKLPNVLLIPYRPTKMPFEHKLLLIDISLGIESPALVIHLIFDRLVERQEESLTASSLKKKK